MLCLTFHHPTPESICLPTRIRERQDLVLGSLRPIGEDPEGTYFLCGLFETAVIALDPGTQVSQESWLGIDFSLLLQLAAVEYPVNVALGLVLMGYSTALIPVQKIDDQTVVWHLEIAKHDFQLKTTELAAVKGFVSALSFRCC